MSKSLWEKIKNTHVSLRFAIVAIFIILSISMILGLRQLTHTRFMNSMTTLAFKLMDESSKATFEQIMDEIRNAQIKSQSTAHLFETNVIDPTNQNEIVTFTTNLMRYEDALFPSVESIFWGDQYGNFISASRNEDGSVTSEIINRLIKPVTRTIIERNSAGDILRTLNSTDLSYDPRTRPWYETALKERKSTWIDVYQYHPSGYLGISIATPVFKKQDVIGVVSLDIRLDYLQKILSNTRFSQQGIIFIVSEDGKLVVFPEVNQYQNKSLMNIHDLTQYPFVIESFDHYKSTREQDFLLRYRNIDYLVTFHPIAHFKEHPLLIGAIVKRDQFIGDLLKTHFITMVIAFSVFIIGIIIMSSLVARIVKPMNKISKEMEKIKHFDLKNRKHIQSHIHEINYIADELYALKSSLRSFQKYVPATLVRQLMASGKDARMGGAKKPLAILFSDISHFTSITEQMPADALAPHLTDYFNALSHIISENQGTIDKYIGDAIMAFWNAPSPIDDPCQHAAIAAIACIKRSNQLNRQWQQENKPVFLTRIGIHFGDAIVGNLGSDERLNYTAIGDAINIANRLVDINKLYGTQIIVSHVVYELIKDQFMLRMVDRVTLKGKAEASYIYELITEKEQDIQYDIKKYRLAFADGFAAYSQANWDDAIRYFSDCLTIYPDDTVANVFITRCHFFKNNPAPDHWNGIWDLKE